MLGAIIGDTVGSIYEFHNTKDYNFTLFNSESGYTDDSIMSMAVAWWLLKDAGHKTENLETIMVNFAEHCPCPMGGYGEMFYFWLFNPWALREHESYPADGKRHPYFSWGNGAAMRTSAVGWFFDTLEETERVAKIAAGITHNHPEGIKGAQATSAAIWMARNGKTKAEIKDYIETRFGYDLNLSWEHLNRTYTWDSSCQGTVPEAIICFLESTDYEDSIRKAVSIGGDSDTLACINGGIAEAYYASIPEHMLERTVAAFPNVFNTIIDEMESRTAYGKRVPNPEVNNKKSEI